VRQILSNLVFNAIKFTETGEVCVCAVPTDRGVRLTVRDTGPGIAAKDLDKVFDKFVQGDASTTRRFGGTGLGLSICRELAEAMGGETIAASGQGEGSTFTVFLPLERTAPEVEAETRQAEAAQAPQPGLKVLVAEDNAMNQIVIRTLHESIGLEAAIVGNGDEALQAWRNEDFDVILMDVQMPVMDGPTACQRIREIETLDARARTPIIALTANVMRHQVAEYRRIGMDDIVAKPIQIEALIRTMNSVLRRSADAQPDLARRSGRAGGG
jgi:CheY-like chemotaxis protein